MSSSDFSLSRVSGQFGLTFQEQMLYEATPERPINPDLKTLLQRYRPLARAISTEKARSEFLIAPILEEVRFQLDGRVSLFSGVDLLADASLGLSGVCDFLFCRSKQQFFVTRPIIAVVEAKNDNPANGYGQCIAEMLGARVFNQQNEVHEPIMFGVVTTGTAWRFLELCGTDVVLDEQEYSIDQVDKILGILAAMLEEKPTR